MTPLEFRVWEQPGTGRIVQIFRDGDSVIRHIRDHVLTEPENTCWALVFGPVFEGFDLASGDGCYGIMKRIADGDEGVLRRMYRAYAMAIEASLDDAWNRGWCGQIGDTYITLCIVGLGIPHDRVVLSAYFLGQGTSEAVVGSREREKNGELFPRLEGKDRRQTRWSREGRGAVPRTREDRNRQRIRNGWSREELIYYDVYNMTIKHIRKMHKPTFYGRGEFLPRSQFGILKTIPAFSGGLKMELEDWLHEFSIFEAKMRGMLEKAE